jgi:hypothetical protein
MTLSKLLSRIVRLETQWREHRNTHKLEQRALKIALQQVNKRDDEHNEVRKQLENERGIYIERTYYEKEHKSLEVRVAALELALGNAAGRQGPISDLVKWGATLLAGIILFLIGHFAWK